MLVNVVGKRLVSFADKTTKEKIEYYEIYCLVDDKQVIGKKCLIARAGVEKAKDVNVGIYQLDYAPRADGSAQLVGIYKVEL